jgi:hypothetical protein
MRAVVDGTPYDIGADVAREQKVRMGLPLIFADTTYTLPPGAGYLAWSQTPEQMKEFPWVRDGQYTEADAAYEASLLSSLTTAEGNVLIWCHAPANMQLVRSKILSKVQAMAKQQQRGSS